MNGYCVASQPWLKFLLSGEQRSLRNSSSKTDFDQTEANCAKNISFLSDKLNSSA